MRMILCLIVSVALTHSPAAAQMGDMDMGMGGMGGMVGPRDRVQYVILLGPDLKPGEKPFLDAYELTQEALSRRVQIRTESVTVDVTTALPETSGISVQARLPEKESDEYKKRIRNEALRFGLTNIQFVTQAEKSNPSNAFLRIGLPNGAIKQVSLEKYIDAAIALDSDNPRIELFYDRPRPDMMDSMGGGMGTYGGVGMDGVMGMDGYGMEGPGGSMSMDMDGGVMYGSFMDGGPPSSPAPSRFAAAEGSVEDGSIVVSWSLEKGYVSAYSSTLARGWTNTKLNGKKMTQPIIHGSICAFYCDNVAYGFSGTLSRWGTLELQQPIEELPPIVLDGTSAKIRTDSDFHVFSATSASWSSRSEAIRATTNRPNETDPFGGSPAGDPFGGPPPAGDPFGGSGAADPFAPTSNREPVFQHMN